MIVLFQKRSCTNLNIVLYLKYMFDISSTVENQELKFYPLYIIVSSLCSMNEFLSKSLVQAIVRSAGSLTFRLT